MLSSTDHRWPRSILVPALLATLLAVPTAPASAQDPDPRARVTARPSQETEGQGDSGNEKDGAAPAEPSHPRVPFTDVTEAAGIDFVHDNAASDHKYLPETMGGGLGFLDYDADGDPDLLLLHSSATADPPVVLYANQGDGRFRDVTRAAGLHEAVPEGFLGMGLAAADLDGDGRPDLYLTGVGRNHLLWNRDGIFVNGTEDAGAAGGADDWSTGAAFFDAEGDGDLDLLVVNYVEWSRALDDERDFRLDGVGRAFGLPQSYTGTQPVLLLNRGDGTFTDATEGSGLEVTDPSTGEPVGKGLAVAVVDVDSDGLDDLFLANDTSRNFLFHNRGDGTFEEVGELYGVAYSPDGRNTGAMGVDHGDLLGDGRLAYAVGNFAAETSSLYRAGEDPTFFLDDALAAGLAPATRGHLTFGVLFLDADLDGRLDLLQTNGHVEPDIAGADPAQSYRQPSQLLWNAGPAPPAAGSKAAPASPPRFVELPASSVGDLARPVAGRGAAAADVDGDGDLDLALGQAGGPVLLLRNEQATGHHWLRLRLVGRAPNRDALGAVVELTAGGATQRRTVQPARGYLSRVELPLTFGLGEADSVDRLRITWPDGREQTVPGDGLAVDRLHEIRQPPPAPGKRED